MAHDSANGVLAHYGIKVLVVHALDRLGRSLPHLVKIITYMAGIFATMAEYERAIISERTRAGMRAAKAKGKQIGNRRRWFDEEKVAELRARGWGQVKIARKLGVGVGRVNAWTRNVHPTPQLKRQGDAIVAEGS